MARCMRVDSRLPPFLWGELMMAAPYICNWISHLSSRTSLCVALARPRATPTASGAQKRVAWLRAGTPFSSKQHQICFPRLGDSPRNTISRHRRTISVTTRSTTTTSRTMTYAGCVELHLRSGLWRRHACWNGRASFTSTSLTRLNFAWGSLACGNFARGSYTRGIITSTRAYTGFCGTKGNQRTRQS